MKDLVSDIVSKVESLTQDIKALQETVSVRLELEANNAFWHGWVKGTTYSICFGKGKNIENIISYSQSSNHEALTKLSNMVAKKLSNGYLLTLKRQVNNGAKDT